MSRQVALPFPTSPIPPGTCCRAAVSRIRDPQCASTMRMSSSMGGKRRDLTRIRKSRTLLGGRGGGGGHGGRVGQSQSRATPYLPRAEWRSEKATLRTSRWPEWQARVRQESLSSHYVTTSIRIIPSPPTPPRLAPGVRSSAHAGRADSPQMRRPPTAPSRAAARPPPPRPASAQS